MSGATKKRGGQIVTMVSNEFKGVFVVGTRFQCYMWDRDQKKSIYIGTFEKVRIDLCTLIYL